MASSQLPQQTVLVTGGSGFLGQHIVRLLQERDDRVDRIRVLDVVPYVNKLGHKEVKGFTSLVGNIVDAEDAQVKDAFVDVDCVVHCAAMVSYEYPPNTDALAENNVRGTENVIALCLRHNVASLVFTSSAEVVLAPYIKGTFTPIIINQTEKKALPPAEEHRLIFSDYAASKLKAERLVLSADKTALANGRSLRTLALRPTLLYGEEDHQLISSLIDASQRYDRGTFVRFAGVGGRQQHTYVGNAAWAHLRAKDVLQASPDSVAGLPVFVTDDTPPQDLIRFAHKLTTAATAAAAATPGRSGGGGVSRWYIPALLAYLIAGIVEVFVTAFLRPRVTLPVSPRAAVSYLSSIVYFSRLRAAIYLQYSPIFSPEESLVNAGRYYNRERFRKMAKSRRSIRRTELIKEE